MPPDSTRRDHHIDGQGSCAALPMRHCRTSPPHTRTHVLFFARNATVFRCRWDGQPCDETNFTTTLTDHGLCYTFNSGKLMPAFIISQTGMEQNEHHVPNKIKVMRGFEIRKTLSGVFDVRRWNGHTVINENGRQNIFLFVHRSISERRPFEFQNVVISSRR